MAVVIETTLGDITVDLYLEQRPVTCLNFLKLCKMKYYNFNLFHTIRSGFIAQTGDPSGEGSGGESIFGLLEGPDKRFFSGEKMPKIRHTSAGLLSMVCSDDLMVGSQFFLTLGPDLDSLDGIHCVIGEVTEGHEVLRKLNETICDESHRPYQDVRITHTVVLEDPYNDPPGFQAPSRSPSPSAERLKGGRIAPDEEIDETQGKSAAEIQEIIEEKEAKARATILEIVGDLPDADIAPPENVLFVCKLNPVTTDEDLEIIFSRFGKIESCEVIRDKKTGDSLQYAFIEFADKKSCEDAYFKMDNVLIDDRRIHVDFSQSVSKMRWLGKGRGVQHFDENDLKDDHIKSKQKNKKDREGNNDNHRYNDREDYNKREKHNDYRRSDQEKEYDRSKRNEHKRQNNTRDRSRSTERSRQKRENSRERTHRVSRNHHSNNANSHFQGKDENHKTNKADQNKKYKESSQKSQSNKRDGRHEKNDRIESRVNNRSEQKYESRSDSKRRQREISDEKNDRKKVKKYHESSVEPRTPSPVSNKKQKNKSKLNAIEKNHSKKQVKKRKRRDSSSSESDSSQSSSSDTSSSSEDNRKKRSKRKRKHSTSSSSSSSDSSETSSSSSSSSDSSSDTSSSSSGSDRKRKNKKKIVKKSRKK